MKVFLSRVGAVLLLCAFLVQPSFAQTPPPEINEATLKSLYQAELRQPDDEYLAKRITDERTRIRSLIDDELNEFLNARAAEETDGTDLTSAVDRQRGTVAALEERQRDRQVDLDLLNEEEKKFYLSATPPEDEGEYRLTETHAELLAKKAILEERVAAVEFFLAPQRERLSKLSFQLRLEQFAGFINVGKYVLLLLAIFFLERFIRLRFLVRIQNRTRRYASMKIFTTAVYMVVIIWILGRLFAEHPGILTSFAIVGAGLAVALSDVVKDLIGWVVIVQGRRFSLGQRITVGGVTGDVIDIGLLRTTILEVLTVGAADLERTGRTIYIPNWHVLSYALTNYNTTSDFLKAEIFVTITFESDWRKAREHLQAILKEETGGYMEKAKRQSVARTQQFYYLAEIPTPIVYTDLGSDGVQFTLRFHVPVGERRVVITNISEKILERFAAETPPILLAYKTSRVFSTPMSPVVAPDRL